MVLQRAEYLPGLCQRGNCPLERHNVRKNFEVEQYGEKRNCSIEYFVMPQEEESISVRLYTYECFCGIVQFHQKKSD